MSPRHTLLQIIEIFGQIFYW